MDPEYVAFVEPRASKGCIATLRERATLREVAHQRLRYAVDRRSVSASAGQLADHILREFPLASRIVLLHDELPSPATLHPELITQHRAAFFAMPRSVALASSVPDEFCRFVLVDFHGPGSVALVRKDPAGHCIEDFRTYVMSLGGMFGMSDIMGEQPDDIFPLLPGPEEIAKKLASVFRVIHGFGYAQFVLVSSVFDDLQIAGAMVESIDRELDGEHASMALSAEYATYRGAVASLSCLAKKPGVLSSVSASSTQMSLRTPHDVAYAVTQITRHVFDPEEPALKDLVKSKPLLVAVDEAVDAIYGGAIRSYAERHLNVVSLITVRGGEPNKSWDQVSAVCATAIESGLARNGVMIGVGGGVVLDIVGLAAALFRRGIAYVRVPTTLLAMIDVAVGVKHGVNYAQKKNIIGTFYPPIGAINDPTFLRTATRRDLACGVAEAIKIALLADRDLFYLLERHLDSLMRARFQAPAIIAREVLERAQVAMMIELAPNLFENDLKRAVDFGHSISPTLESASHYMIQHGEAVAIDMLISTAIAIHRGMCQPRLLDRLVRMYDIAELPVTDDLCTIELLGQAISEVRAHRGGNLNLVVPTGVGTYAFLQQVDETDFRVALDAVANATRMLVNGA